MLKLKMSMATSEERQRMEKINKALRKWFVKLDGDFATLLSYFA